MNKKNLHQLLFLLSFLAIQNNILNAMKRSIDLISGPEKTEYSPLKQQKQASNAAALVCNICNKGFLYPSYLTIHKRSHTGEKPYSCYFCDKSFSQKNHLTVHERIHTGEKPYTCSLCNKSFAGKGDLSNHERIHTGEKPYTCSLCNKGFTQKSHLTIHKKIHTGEKPYSCTLCNKSFARKDHLTKHMTTHANKDTPLINSSKASSKKAPINTTSTRLVPLAIQKTIETAQTQKNEKVIQEAMKPLSDKDLINWISSNNLT